MIPYPKKSKGIDGFMSTTVVISQMTVILILILTGALLFKKGFISDETGKHLSNLIIYVTNPASLILSAFSTTEKAPLSKLGLGLVCFVIAYAVLMIMAVIIPRLLRVPKNDRYSYKMLTVFANVGFLGIPLASALLGSDSLIYVSECNLIFNLLIYTFGIRVLERTKESPEKSHNFKFSKLINIGTVSSVLTVILYLCDIKIPATVASTLDYAGRSTVFLSMTVLGITVAQIVPKELFTNIRLYFFSAFRLVVIPIGLALIFKQFVNDELILATVILEMSVPCANMPLMLSKQMDVDGSTISKGIILTTLLALLTIPLVSLVL